MEAARSPASRSRPRSRARGAASPPAGREPPAEGASMYLANLPSRGLFSSTAVSSNPGGIRVYVCDHDTDPPEEQFIKTDATNILIRALQMNKQKNESPMTKSGPGLKGKRPVSRTSEGKTPTKRVKTPGASSSTVQEGSNSGFSEETLRTMTVERLRALSRERGLPTKGRKEELIGRLRG